MDQAMKMATALKPELLKPQAAIHGALLTVEEAAALLRVPVSWVYERTRRRSLDRLPGIRLGKYWRFRESDLLAWIERQRVGGRANA
jgi:excisionase family DNA binding protein